MTTSIAIDLTALQPAWLAPDGSIRELCPSFCLPTHAREPCLVGHAAALHRRGRDRITPYSDCQYEPKNPSRRYLAEIWLSSTSEPDSVRPDLPELGWSSPSGQTVRVSCADVIRECVRECIPPGSSRRVSATLVVPAALGPGPRQTLLDNLERVCKEVLFVPRPVAVALDWLTRNREQVKRALPAGASAGQRVLLVLVAGADRWEMARVPLVPADAPFQCLPVHDRVDTVSETEIIGIVEAALHAAENDTPESVLDAFLASMVAPPRLAPFQDRADRSIREMLNRDLRVPRLDAVLVPGTDAYQILDTAIRGDVETGRLLASVLAGSVSEPGHLPGWMREMVSIAGLPTDTLPPHAPLHGARAALELFHTTGVPYFEALAPLQIYCWDRNQYHDPKPSWRNLFSKPIVAASQEYRSPSKIPGFWLSPGEEVEIDFVLRTQRRGLWHVKRIKETARQDLTQRTEVAISVRAQPGRGLARIHIDSVEPGLFSTVIREDHAQPIQETEIPSPEYAWPPGSAWVVSHPLLVDDALPHLERLLDCLRKNDRTGRLIQAIKYARDAINSWRIPTELQPPVDPESLNYPKDEIESLFVYLGVFPSAPLPVRATDPAEEVLRELTEILPARFQSSNTDVQQRLLWFCSWLYARCPAQIFDFVRDAFQRRRFKMGPLLACIGNCAHELDDYRMFFEEIHDLVKSRRVPPQFWIRAYRNLARFRPDALRRDVLPDDIQDALLDEYLGIFSNAQPRQHAFLHSCYLAPQILKRRRFDDGFLPPDDRRTKRFDMILRWAASVAISYKHRTNCKCAREFLHRRADRRTLEYLASVEEA